MSDIRLLRFPEVKEKVGLCRAQIYNLAKDGDFPKPVKIGARSKGWVESEVDQWIKDRISNQRLKG